MAKKETYSSNPDASSQAIQGELEKILGLQTSDDIREYAKSLEKRKEDAAAMNTRIEKAKGIFGFRRMISGKAQDKYNKLLLEARDNGLEYAQVRMINQQLLDRQSVILAKEQEEWKVTQAKKLGQQSRPHASNVTTKQQNPPLANGNIAIQAKGPGHPNPTAAARKKPRHIATHPLRQMQLKEHQLASLSLSYGFDKPSKDFLIAMEMGKRYELFTFIQRLLPNANKIQIEKYDKTKGNIFQPSFPKLEGEDTISIVTGTRQRGNEKIAVICTMTRQEAIRLDVVKDPNLEQAKEKGGNSIVKKIKKWSGR